MNTVYFGAWKSTHDLDLYNESLKGKDCDLIVRVFRRVSMVAIVFALLVHISAYHPNVMPGVEHT
jgi:hypothetical protein